MALRRAFVALLALVRGAPAAASAGGAAGECLDGFADTYEITGCATAAHCGTYRRRTAHCEPGPHCPSSSDRTLCDRAPVYQLEGGGPVLYRCVFLPSFLPSFPR
eukprot:COSAG06_NODE_6611_length_2855_cov_73.242383_2_plen_105_part_00